jgi:YycE-like C-terminal domain
VFQSRREPLRQGVGRLAPLTGGFGQLWAPARPRTVAPSISRIFNPDQPYHLEFTRAQGHRAGRAPTSDNLLVFYLPDESQWSHAVARLRRAGCEPVPSFNPYWDRQGLTFEDPDGYRVVLQHAAWDL